MERNVLTAVDDIAPLTVRDFDRYHAMLRTLHAELLPRVLAAHYPAALSSPIEFDQQLGTAVAADMDNTHVSEVKSAVAWYRCTAWLDARRPEAAPPTGFDTNGLQLHLGPAGYRPKLDSQPPHIEAAVASALKRCTTTRMQQVAALCEKHRGAVMANQPIAAFANPEAVDEVLQRALITTGPAELRDFSEQRPTVFDVLSSCHRYRPALVALQRSMLLQTEAGGLSIGDAAAQLFDRIAPNSAKIKQEIIRQHTPNN